MRLFLLSIFFISILLRIKANQCGKNEGLNICGKTCEPTCHTFSDEIKNCTIKDCKGKSLGCRCNNGFVRDERTGKCERPNQCSRCDYGEVYLPCGQLCEASCHSSVKPKICQRMFCAHSDCRCHFEGGFVRDHSTGRCVLQKNCKKN
ncbi:zonadhesin-like [Microplitis mediator]|uniref:zonadhesin-like n=1 Tax=Microplitis mediator TaxID=375433 RepID=UPI002556B8D1|nr:zonadhesin-like [Microplitis mediator]